MTKSIESMKETIAAQAAVIEKLLDVFQKTLDLSEVKVLMPSTIEAICRNALSIPTYSTQILDEVRREERERCAQYVQQGTGDWMLGKKIAEAIRAME